MKNVVTRCFAVIFMLAFTCCLTCCCASPLSEREINASQNVFFDLYVCGAVENEGFYRVKEGTSYYEIICSAGVLPETYMPDNASSVADRSVSQLIVNYFEHGKVGYAVNVNGILPNGEDVYGIPNEITNSVSSYVYAHGKIKNKNVLKRVLGEKYSDFGYKFYVSVEDYEARN